ncbi:hypothetical protein MKY95_23055 [Paenibacillus sp. FSL P4-0176]|uniref:hypothetical protein n=1 Tax=Paenibacillus sp. FSL P4-0176 TaxID=2921631 RepID=UPI0030CAF353
MKTHRIDVSQSINQEIAKKLAQILVSAQGVSTPAYVTIVSPTTEHTVIIN